MRDNIVIKAENVSKKYCKDLKGSMIYGIEDIGRNLVGLNSRSNQLRKNEFYAVNDVSFEVKRGETLGIIGPNGSGKTTMLKMLNGIFWPDKGKITVKGKVGALIAVGAGFHPQLSGRENVYINGAILGMSKREIDKKFDAIVDFSEIGEFLDAPVKHYSSGMYVRLGFAIAVHSESEILLIDEILSVGDINFRSKCTDKMKELDKKGVTKIFISHNLDSVQTLCDQTIYLLKGKVHYQGDTLDVINKFKNDVMSGKEVSQGIRQGTREVEINKVEFIDQHHNVTDRFKRGDKLKVKISYFAKRPIHNPHFSVGFHTEKGLLFSKAITYDHGIDTGNIEGEGEVDYTVDNLPLTIGRYLITISCWDSTGNVAYDHHEKLYTLNIDEGAIKGNVRERYGLVYIPSEWEIIPKN